LLANLVLGPFYDGKNTAYYSFFGMYVHAVILPDRTLKKWGLSNFDFGIHQHPMQKEFLKSCEGFLRAALTVLGHFGPF
jgi:hypothetical protein